MVELGPVDDELLLEQYQSILLTMDMERIESGGSSRKWNRLVDKLQGVQLALRTSPAGRTGISALIGTDNATVSLWSATFALSWDPEPARAELERLAGGAGLLAFEAEVTLKEFDAGRLNTLWVPKTPGKG